MFEISFKPESAGFESPGRVVIADHQETFTASHAVWDRRRYEQQWREAADRVLAGQPGCFVTDLALGRNECRGECWIVWPEGEVGVVQNQLLLATSGFDADDPHAFLPAVPQRVTEEGTKVSTWRVRLTDIGTWRRRHIES